MNARHLKIGVKVIKFLTQYIVLPLYLGDYVRKNMYEQYSVTTYGQNY